MIEDYITVSDAGCNYADNFDDGDASNWDGEEAYWSVSDGAYEGNYMSGPIKTTWAPEEAQIGDGTFSFSFTPKNAAKTQTTRMYLGDHYHFVEANTGGNRWELVDNFTEVLAGYDGEIQPETTYYVEIILNGKDVEVYIDNEKRLEGSFDEIQTGKIGFGVKRAKSRFDNICLSTSGGGLNANFSGEPINGEAPLEVSFTDESTGGPTSWQWDFDNDGNWDSNEQNPSYTYSSAGEYSVKLKVSKDGNSDTKLITNYITVSEPTGGCDYEEDFTDGSGGWEMNDYWSITGGALEGEHQVSGGIKTTWGPEEAQIGSGTFSFSFTPMVAAKTQTTRMYIGDYRHFVEAFTSRNEWKLVDNFNETLDSYTGDLEAGTTYEVEIEISGTDVEVRIDGITRLTGSFDEAQTGKIGFGVKRATSKFDDICLVSDAIAKGSGEGAEELTQVIPETTKLVGNYPNPFNPSTTIQYDIKEATYVSLVVYNIQGEKVKTLVNDYKGTGSYRAVWNGENESGSRVAGGVYIYRMIAGDYTQAQKMLLVK